MEQAVGRKFRNGEAGQPGGGCLVRRKEKKTIENGKNNLKPLKKVVGK